MKTIEQLAEIHQNASSEASRKGNTVIVPWSIMEYDHKAARIAGMQAALDTYLSSIGEGMPSLENCTKAWTDGYDQGRGLPFKGTANVRNLLLSAFAKKMETIAKLPEKWRKMETYAAGMFAEYLEAALGPLPVEPVPEVQSHAELASLQKNYEIERNCSGDRMAEINAQADEIDRLTAEVARYSGNCKAMDIIIGEKRAELAKANAELYQSNERVEAKQAAYERCADQLAEANAELERLRWRPVSVKPTAQDATKLGFVETYHQDGDSGRFGIAAFPWEDDDVTHWRPFCPPPAPTAEEKERAEFEAFAQSQGWFTDRNMADESYNHSSVNTGWRVWQARASKEVKA